MSKQEVKLLSDEQKQAVIDYYLAPHSYSDTAKYFKFSNLRYDLDVILKEFNIPHHNKANRDFLCTAHATICKYCGKKIRNCNLAKHLKAHESKAANKINSNKYILDHDDLFCKFCGKECKNKNSLINHERYCKKNVNAVESPLVKYHKDFISSWNKGLTKETDKRVLKYSKTHKERIASGEIIPHQLGLSLSEEHKQKISTALLEYNHADNKRNLHSHGGWYNGMYFMSTWELAYYIYMSDLNKNIIRCLDRFEYQWQGHKHYYTPDFIVNNCYIEIKGKEWPKDLVKYAAVRKVADLQVIYYNDVKNYINYTLTKFNINKLEDLYQKDIDIEST